MESGSQFYNKAASRDFDEDEPYFNEDEMGSRASKLPKQSKLSAEEAKKANESIFNKVPSIRPEQNSIIHRLGNEKIMDIDKSNEYFVKIKAIEYLSSFLTIANIWNCMILYEMDYKNTDGEFDNYVDTQLNLSTFFSLTLTFLVNFRYYIELKWKKSKNFVIQKDTLWTAGMVKWMVLETIISVISPHSIFKGKLFSNLFRNYAFGI